MPLSDWSDSDGVVSCDACLNDLSFLCDYFLLPNMSNVLSTRLMSSDVCVQYAGVHKKK